VIAFGAGAGGGGAVLLLQEKNSPNNDSKLICKNFFFKNCHLVIPGKPALPNHFF